MRVDEYIPTNGELEGEGEEGFNKGKELVIEKLDELQRSISMRKVEINTICHHEKLPKPIFTDLNWVIDQIYWLKKTL